MSILSAVFSGVVGAVAVGVLTQRGLRPPRPKAGWRSVTPGPMLYVGLCVCGVLFAFLSILLANDHSGSFDTLNDRFFVGIYLFTIFALLFGILLTYPILRDSVKFNSNVISFRISGNRINQSMRDIKSIYINWLGFIFINFSDGTVIRLYSDAKGAHLLCSRILRVNPMLERER
jgi:hypothetical protein